MKWDVLGWTGLVLLALTAVIVLMAYALVLIWAWTIPDVFSGAVTLGILPAYLSFWQAIKLALLASLINGSLFVGMRGR
ncbi:MAG: hypothetical protein Q7K03_10565 [Dehalococcoidia bacterium]|nr:hypothetical protein [Dehalococcoidia bacterium]